MQKQLKQATTEELAFYKERVYPAQDEILRLSQSYPDLYLTGETALARFYLHHRLSEDLDLFIKIRKRDSYRTIESQKRADYLARDLAGKLSRNYRIVNPRFGEYHSLFFVQIGSFPMKIDVVREYHHIGRLNRRGKGFRINNLKDIAVNKLTAFEDRAEVKDIFDLYFLTHIFSLDELFRLADLKREPIAYENLLTINVTGLSGSVVLTRKVDVKEMEAFLENLRLRTEEEINKKELRARENLDNLIRQILWDFPLEERVVNRHSLPVLKRRLGRLPLPEHLALEQALNQYGTELNLTSNCRESVIQLSFNK